MKKLAILMFVLFSSISINAQSIAGVWNTGDDNTKVEITEVDGVASGTILSSDNSEAKVGNQILKDLSLTKDGWKGKLYAAKKGEWYDATIVEKDNQLDITIQVGWMSKTINWTK